MKIESKLIKDLKPATYNPRQISTKQYNDLKESIKKFGLVDPIIINQNGNVVVGGHQRLKICKELKYIEIDCVVLDLSKEEERELNIRLNKNSGEFDMDILANEFDIDELVDWGFKHIDLDINIDKITEGNTEDDHIPEVKESRVKLGDIWQLGKHRLMCGDSTKESDVEKLMNGQKADIGLTDPPYGVGYEYNTHQDVRGEEYIYFCEKFLKQLKKNSDFQIITGGNRNAKFYINQNSYIEMLIWNKKFGLSPGSCYRAMINEYVYLLGQKPKNKFYNTDYIECMTDREKDLRKKHTCPKPVNLFCELLKPMTKKDDLILDLFLGSGTTLIACEKTNRICYGMELDTKYCDVIIERWEQFTGQKAIKIN